MLFQGANAASRANTYFEERKKRTLVVKVVMNRFDGNEFTESTVVSRKDDGAWGEPVKGSRIATKRSHK
jgi:hypothetical protein